ncbi:MAG: hypothetical protein ACI8PW_002063 [Methylophilaceae bacterium]|jgi:hypothetical protein
MSIATGLATSKEATPKLAKLAVIRAMEKTGINTPSAILLF